MKRRSGSRRLLAGAVLALALPGCVTHSGPSIDTFAPARSPLGAMVSVLTIQISTPSGVSPPQLVEGELLEVSETGLLVLRTLEGGEPGAARRGVVTRIDWIVVDRVELPDYEVTHRGSRRSAGELETLALLSRFPPGLSAEMLRELLTFHGQVEPARVRRVSDEAQINRGPGPGEAELLARARTAAERFREVDEAILSGYRPIGPDFPAMGSHWVNTSILLRDGTDPDNPPFLTYLDTPRGTVLTGVALGQVRLPGAPIEGLPVPGAWHDHSGSVDEEILALGLHGAGHGGDPVAREDAGLAMLHIWTGLENAAGVFAQENLAIPFVRLGLPVPELPGEEAGRALFLAAGGDSYYLNLFEALKPLADSERSIAEEVLGGAAERARGLARDPSAESTAELEAVWLDLWKELERRLPEETWRAVRELGPSRVPGAPGGEPHHHGPGT